MFEFAQTNLQLYRQMAELGYSAAEREQLASAYRFLIPMFSSQFRGTEKPFICHLVGTASILASNRSPISLVTAGLLHAVYMAGDFGFQPGTRQTNRKRTCVRKLAGEEVENIVATYDKMRWDSSSLASYRSVADSRQGPLRSAITLQLANTLEDFLDHGVNYCSGEKFASLSCPEMQAELIAMSEIYAWPALTENMTRAIADFNTGATAVDQAACMGLSARVLPPSSRRKFLPTAQGWLVRRIRRIMATLSAAP